MSIRISVRMLGNCTPVVFQGAEQLLVASGSDPGSNQHHQIPASQHLLVLAETFAYQPFDTVPLHGAARILYRNSRSKACIAERIG